MKLYSVALLGLLLLLSIETTEPTMSISYNEQVAPGEQVFFTIRIDNTTVDACNGGAVFIDTAGMDQQLLDHVVIINEREDVGAIEPTGSVVDLVLAMEVLSDAPNGVYDVPITFEGTLGHCDGGCFPFSITQICQIEIKRRLPEMYYEFDRTHDFTVGDSGDVLFSFANRGMGSASNCNIFVTGSIGAEVIPCTFNEVGPQESHTVTISFDTERMNPDFYYLNVNITYYDDYFKLYTEKVPFMVQVRPPNPQLDMEILHTGKSLIIDLSNQGGLKAVDIQVSVDVGGILYASEAVDELIPRGALLVPLSLDDRFTGDVPISATVAYSDLLGNVYEGHREIFISISENTTRNTSYLYYGIFGIFLVVGSVLLLRRKSWNAKQ
jgi:hypothetical protein